MLWEDGGEQERPEETEKSTRVVTVLIIGFGAGTLRSMLGLFQDFNIKYFVLNGLTSMFKCSLLFL